MSRKEEKIPQREFNIEPMLLTLVECRLHTITGPKPPLSNYSTNHQHIAPKLQIQCFCRFQISNYPQKSAIRTNQNKGV
ncbi:hypothetical protein VNO80_21120 [Phaseolus coccineus]|uniref:Uncharacterized protein n=1 Tax=Phaseolus coccineus TaxID=3886 RepID=A0AAN9M7A6_PHACN